MNDTIIKALQEDRKQLEELDLIVQKAQAKVDDAQSALKDALWQQYMKMQRIRILIGELAVEPLTKQGMPVTSANTSPNDIIKWCNQTYDVIGTDIDGVRIAHHSGEYPAATYPWSEFRCATHNPDKR